MLHPITSTTDEQDCKEKSTSCHTKCDNDSVSFLFYQRAGSGLVATRQLDSPVGLSQSNPSHVGFDAELGEWAGVCT